MFVKKKMITTVVAQIMIVRIALLYVRYNGHGGNISLRLEFWLMRSFEVPSSLTIIISGFLLVSDDRSSRIRDLTWHDIERAMIRMTMNPQKD